MTLLDAGHRLDAGGKRSWTGVGIVAIVILSLLPMLPAQAQTKSSFSKLVDAVKSNELRSERRSSTRKSRLEQRRKQRARKQAQQKRERFWKEQQARAKQTRKKQIRQRELRQREARKVERRQQQTRKQQARKQEIRKRSQRHKQTLAEQQREKQAVKSRALTQQRLEKLRRMQASQKRKRELEVRQKHARKALAKRQQARERKPRQRQSRRARQNRKPVVKQQFAAKQNVLWNRGDQPRFSLGCRVSGKTNGLHPRLRSRLCTMSRQLGPVTVVSGCRNSGTNASPRSYHRRAVGCMAADVRIAGTGGRRILSYWKKSGGGTGSYCGRSFVHVDVGPTRSWIHNCRRRS